LNSFIPNHECGDTKTILFIARVNIFYFEINMQLTFAWQCLC